MVRAPAFLTGTLLAALPVATLSQQLPDARLIPRGTLRIGFTPQYQSWDRVFDEDGSEQPLGRYFSADTAGANLFSTLLAPQSAVRAITGDTAYRMTLGAVRMTLDGDARRFPLEFSLGLTGRITLSANLPIVVTRMNAALSVDSGGGNVGWNQAATVESGNPVGRSQLLALLAQLDASAADLGSRTDAGQFGCPASASCAQAQSLIARTLALRTNLAILAGVSPEGGLMLAPAAPTATSGAGKAIVTAIGAVSAELQAFGVAPIAVPTTLLPTKRLGASDVQTILSASTFGYEAGRIQYTKRWGLGDAEVGLQLGLVQAPRARVLLYGTARLPTGQRDSPDNFIDIGRGDRQTDLAAGLEAVVAPGPVSLAVAGSYTWQLPDQLERRATPPEQPIAPASSTFPFKRDLGDVLWLGAYPALSLSPAFRVYASGTYYRKLADRFEFQGATTQIVPPPTPPGAMLERKTVMQALSFGGGIAYRSEPRGGGLPVEAGLHYQAGFTGSGGFAPKTTALTMYVRAFYPLWGGGDQRAPGAGLSN